ncbi:MAG TPA: tetratricopeptide repeat protein [Syntrophorhabdaceae bacterium]|nr:tetratricopeptide repeat protein [Syntrophorhabdaceae bacterium]HRV23213.1 tetratricopeptide repeat protein [Syntrophorhabdaceae bacterium]
MYPFLILGIKIRDGLWPFTIIIVAITVYANALWGVFQFDDYNVIVFNPSVHSLKAWWQDAGSGIRQLLKLTYTLNWLAGPNSFGFHVFNMVCHAVNSFLIYYLTKRLTYNAVIAFITALFFAVHPIQTESVTYISGRSSSLMAVFYLGSLLAYTRVERSSGWGGRWGLFSALLFLLAILTKEVSLTLPFALVLWELCVSEKPIRFMDMLKRQAFHWLIFIASLSVFFLFTRYTRLILFSMNLRSLKSNLLSQLNGITSTVSHYLLLNRLNIDPDLPVISRWSLTVGIEFLFLCVIVAAGIFSLVRLIRKKSETSEVSPQNQKVIPQPEIYPVIFSFSVFWFIIQLIPTSTLIPRIDIINERHFYLAGWVIFLLFSSCIVYVFAKIINNMKCMWVTVIVLAMLAGGFTIARNHIYRNEIALWEDTVKKSPNKARGYNNLGYAYFLAGRYDDAIRAYKKALEINPNHTLARNNLEMAYKASKRR